MLTDTYDYSKTGILEIDRSQFPKDHNLHNTHSVFDPEFELTIEELQEAIADGNNYGKHIDVDIKINNLLVHHCNYKNYVIYIAFGTPRQLSKSLQISLAVPARYKKQVLPAILGWTRLTNEEGHKQ